VPARFLAMLALAPVFAARVRSGTRQTRFAGAAVPNYFRVPYGPALGAMAGDPAAMDGFVRVAAGVDPPAVPAGKTG
jgi:hypothetical protein